MSRPLAEAAGPLLLRRGLVLWQFGWQEIQSQSQATSTSAQEDRRRELGPGGIEGLDLGSWQELSGFFPALLRRGVGDFPWDSEFFWAWHATAAV